MKDKFDIDHIQTLLHKYYEAETTPEEDRLLESLFRNTPTEELPEAMAEEGIFFSSLPLLHPCEDDIVIPTDLYEKITIITESRTDLQEKKVRRIWPRRLAYAVGAACACLLLYFGYRNLPFVHQPEQTQAVALSQDGHNRLDDGYIEITDPEEAEKIMADIATLLAANTKQSNEAVRHLEQTLNEYRQLTKSILQ